MAPVVTVRWKPIARPMCPFIPLHMQPAMTTLIGLAVMCRICSAFTSALTEGTLI